MLWHKTRQADDKEMHSSSRNLLTHKLDVNEFEASIEKFAWLFTQQL